MNQKSLCHILLVEDDEIDAEAVRRAFGKHGLGIPIEIATDGVYALARLRGDTGEAPIPHPRLVLLDLNMPRMNGIEFLRELRRDPNLRSTVVFVLTTSDAQRDKSEAYALNVAGYLVKSRLGDDFGSLVELLASYCESVEFPSS